MKDNVFTGPDAQANHILGMLRDGEMSEALTAQTRLLPGLHFHADESLGISGQYHSPAGGMLDLDVRTTGDGAWAALHLALNAPDLSPFGVIGLACRTSAPETRVIRPCLRSGTPDGFEDCFFDKHILSQPEESSHLDALPVHRRDRLPLTSSWRELILFMPTESFRWSLIDLRVFIV